MFGVLFHGGSTECLTLKYTGALSNFLRRGLMLLLVALKSRDASAYAFPSALFKLPLKDSVLVEQRNQS